VIQLQSSSKNINRTKRLEFEFINEKHAEVIFEKINDPRIYRYIPPNKYNTLELLKKRYKSLSIGSPEDRSCVWINWILKDISSSQYIGWIQATVYDNGTALLAYVIFPEYWNMGFAKESCNTVINHIFISYYVGTIIAEIDTRNIPSIRLIKSLGFRLVDTKKNADYFNGSTSDEYCFKLDK
jgi:[ribosomal protein S5]-alanine N-acetyltransferase